MTNDIDPTLGPTLDYEWWTPKKRSQLPKYLGKHKNNYVLSLPELVEYHELLQEMQALVAREAAAVKLQYRAMTTPRLLSYEGVPRCTTIAHVLEYKVAYMKIELKLMDHLKRFAQERIAQRDAEAKEAAERG